MFDAVTDVDMERLEEFFTSRGAPVFHEVSPMAHPELLETLAGRGYRPIEMSAVLVRDLSGGESLNQRRSSNITTRVIGSGEVDIWASTSAAGWATEHESLGDFMLNFGKISANCRGSYPYIAEFEGKPVATGMMFVHEGVAILAGASTVPDGRNKGAQNALLFDRLAHAADLGCNMAMMAAAPGSQSQCNAQKNGFEIAYTRTKWQLST
jgi:hypothetical protein